MSSIRLGVNIDHVATVRQARGGQEPRPEAAAILAVKAGADGITAHLREDRRHIQDSDLLKIRKVVSVPLNLEMALAPEIVKIALRLSPEKVCLVPERREEVTTEGGLDAFSKRKVLEKVVAKLRRKKIEVSLFIEPSFRQIQTAARVGAHAIEIHTGAYANAKGLQRKRELGKIQRAVQYALRTGLKVNAGHGLDYENVSAIAKIPGIQELNIGHSIVSRALFVGFGKAVSEMKQAMLRGR